LQELQELQEFRSSGVLEFRSSGVLEFRSSGVQECWSAGVAEFGTDCGARKPEFLLQLLNSCNS
jgi:hypothetical protein